MQPYERIEKVLKHLKLSANKFAKEIGLPNGRPQRIYDIKGKGHGISADLAKKITDTFPQISYQWLLSGEGEMLEQQPEPTPTVNEPFAEYSKSQNIIEYEKRIAELEATIKSQQEEIKKLEEDKQGLEADKKDLKADKEDLIRQRDDWKNQFLNLQITYNDLVKKRETELVAGVHTAPGRAAKKIPGE